MMNDSSEASLALRYSLQLSLRIDWSELDVFAHVNNVAILKYIQASRVNYWDVVGISALYAQQKIGPMLASTACQFKRPLFYPGSICVEAGVDFIKTTSFGIRHRILDDSGNLAAEAQDIVVMYDFNREEKIAIPAQIRAAIEAVEQRTF